MYFVAFLLLCASGEWANVSGQKGEVSPGAQIRLTKSGLQYLADIEVKALREKLTNYRVPDQSGGGHHFTYSATNIIIKYLNVAGQSISTIPNVGVSLAVRGITIPASGRVHVRYKRGWVKVSDTTNVEITASRVSFALDIKIDARNQKPFVTTTKCSADIGKVHLRFHGGLSWLYNLLSGLLARKLKDILKKEMCKQGIDLVNNKGNKALQAFPVRKNIKDYAYIDYSFQQPKFTSQYMDLYLRGEFLNFKKPVHSALTPTPFDTTSASSKMVYIWLSDYSLNSAGEVFHKAQLLHKAFKLGDKIPAGVKPFLNTGTLKQFIPQLYKQYPDRPIEIRLETFSAPRFHVRAGSVTVQLYVRAGINVVTKEKKLVPVFHLDISVDATGLASLKSTSRQLNIGGIIITFKFGLTVGGSIIGAVNLPVDNQSIKDMVRGLVVDQANPILDRGFPIPQSGHLELKNPAIKLVRGAIRIDTMVEYHLGGRP